MSQAVNQDIIVFNERKEIKKAQSKPIEKVFSNTLEVLKELIGQEELTSLKPSLTSLRDGLLEIKDILIEHEERIKELEIKEKHRKHKKYF